MLSKQRTIFIPFVGLFSLCLLVVLFLAVRKRPSKSTSSKKVSKHKVETPPDEALKYWTADKMNDAKPAPLPQVNKLDQEKQSTRPSPTQDA